MLDTRVVTYALSIFTAVTYVVCVAYGLIVPESLHMSQGLEIVLPGFRWISWPSFALGLIESALYGVYAGLVFGSLYNSLWKRAHQAA